MFYFLLILCSEQVYRFTDAEGSIDVIMPAHHTLPSKLYTLRRDDLQSILACPAPKGGSHYTKSGTGSYSGLYFKVLEKKLDEHPENEFFCYSLYKALGCERYIVPTVLIDGLSQYGKEYWIQISPQEPEKDLAKMVQEQLQFLETKAIDPENYSWHIVMTFLLYLADAKGDNYIVREMPTGYELVSIDHEMSLDEVLYPVFISVLFYYDEYEKVLSGSVREKLLQFDSNMFSWREALETVPETEFFSKATRERKFKEVQTRFQKIQSLLRTREQIKHKELLETFFPDVAQYYGYQRTIMKKEEKNPCEMTEQTIYDKRDQSFCAMLCRRKELEPGMRRLLLMAATEGGTGKPGHAGSVRELGSMYEWDKCTILENLSLSSSEKIALRWLIARKYYKRAVDLGDRTAHLNLARLLKLGIGGYKDEREANELLKRAGVQGEYQPEELVGPSLYCERATGIDMMMALPRYPWEKSSPHFLNASAMSVPLAQFSGISTSFYAQQLPTLPQFGLGILIRNDPSALELLEELAHIVDDPEAWCCLASMYERGFGGSAEKKNQAIACLKKAADKTHAQAQFVLGIRYLEGVGVKKNEQEALVCMEKSARNGNVNAQYCLFLWNRNGLTELPRNIQQALFWGEKAVASVGVDVAIAGEFNGWKTEQMNIKERVRAKNARGIKRSEIAKQESIPTSDVIEWCKEV